MKKIILLLLLTASVSWGAAGTCITTGISSNWSDPTAWDCGGVPPFTHYSSALIQNGHQITVQGSVTLPRTYVGDPLRKDPSDAYASLYIAPGATVDMAGNLYLRPEKVGASIPYGKTVMLSQGAGSTLNMHSYKIITGYYTNTWDSASRFLWYIAGEPGSRAKITGEPGSSIDYFNSSLGGRIVWSYADFQGVGWGTTNRPTNTLNGDAYGGTNGGIAIDNSTFKNTAGWVFGTSSTQNKYNAIAVTNCDFRNVTSSKNRSGSDKVFVQVYRSYTSSNAATNFVHNTLSNQAKKMNLMFYNTNNATVSNNVFDAVTVDAANAANSVFQYNFFLNRGLGPSYNPSDYSFYAPAGVYNFSYNGYLAIYAGAHGLSTGKPSLSGLRFPKAGAPPSQWHHNWMHSKSVGDNPLRIGGGWHQEITNNIFTGSGSGISATALNSYYSPTISIRNNTFTTVGSALSTGTGGTMYMQEDTGSTPAGSPSDYAYTQFVNNLAVNTETSIATSLYISNVSCATMCPTKNPGQPNQVDSLRYNLYYDPLSKWTKFWDNSIFISQWVNDSRGTGRAISAVNKFKIFGADATATYVQGSWVRVKLSDNRYRVSPVLSSTLSGSDTEVTIMSSSNLIFSNDMALSILSVDYNSGTQVAGDADMIGERLTADAAYDPQMLDKLYTPMKWAYEHGQTGSEDERSLWICSELIKQNSTMDINGNWGATAASFDVLSIWNALSYKLTPRNTLLNSQGEGGTYVGFTPAVSNSSSFFEAIF